MIVTADLHTHSAASDGQYAPAELVRLAKGQGLELLALTDHDTLDGLPMKDGRDERKYRIIDFLREKGLELTLEEVEEIAGGNIIARPHFAQAMVRRGYVRDNREAFDRYLDTDEYQRIERFKADARTCVETIKAAGGKVSLAHPYQIGLEDGPLEALVKELAGYGLDAIECYYPKHTPAQEAFYLRLAEKYGLYVTGGSDFHGPRVKPDIRLAALELETGWLTEG